MASLAICRAAPRASSPESAFFGSASPETGGNCLAGGGSAGGGGALAAALLFAGRWAHSAVDAIEATLAIESAQRIHFFVSRYERRDVISGVLASKAEVIRFSGRQTGLWPAPRRGLGWCGRRRRGLCDGLRRALWRKPA